MAVDSRVAGLLGLLVCGALVVAAQPMGLLAAPLATGAMFQPSTSPGERLGRLRAEYLETKERLRPHYGQMLDDDPAAASLLNRLWALTAEWTAHFVDGHPATQTDDLASALEQLDPDLDASAVALGPGTFAVAVSEFEIGTFFVVGDVVARRG